MPRYQALDALRGLTIALMILVNSPGSWASVYAPLRHSNWHGCTPTDLVFPFFLMVAGASMFFSFRKIDFMPSRAAWLRIMRRVAVLFAIGLLLNAYPFIRPLSDLRVMGVLQRIALAYGVAAMLVLLLNRRALLAVSVAILLCYWGLLWAGGGDAGPYSLESNIVRQVDLAILGASHMWQHQGLAFDPEGLLSTLPAVVQVVTGFELTRWIVSAGRPQQGAVRLLAAGLAALMMALLWNGVWPVNKSLWTGSYVIFAAGVFCFVLAFFVWLIDVKGHVAAARPLIVYGMNPLFVYVLAWLWVDGYALIELGATDAREWLYQQLRTLFEPMNASLAFALAHVILFWCVAWLLYRRNIVIKL